MDLVEQTVAFFKSIEARDWHKLGAMLAADFRYHGAMHDPADKKTWLDYQEAVGNAFSDWEFHLSDVQAEGASAKVTVQITGTHDGELALPLEGFQPVAATGKSIKMPEEHATVDFNDAGQVSKLKVEPTPHGTLPGLLEQLGLE